MFKLPLTTRPHLEQLAALVQIDMGKLSRPGDYEAFKELRAELAWLSEQIARGNYETNA